MSRFGMLCRYLDGSIIRPATRAEMRLSRHKARSDGGHGLWMIEDPAERDRASGARMITVFVQGGSERVRGSK